MDDDEEGGRTTLGKFNQAAGSAKHSEKARLDQAKNTQERLAIDDPSSLPNEPGDTSSRSLTFLDEILTKNAQKKKKRKRNKKKSIVMETSQKVD